MEASSALIISPDDDNDSTESDSEYDSEHDSDVDMRNDGDVDAPDGVDLDSDVDMERDVDEEEYETKEEEVVEDEGEGNGKEPRMIGQGEMLNTSPDNADTLVDNQLTVLPEQGKEMREHTQWPQPLVPARWAHTTEVSPTTTNCWYSYPQWAGVFWACKATKTSPSSAKYGRI